MRLSRHHYVILAAVATVLAGMALRSRVAVASGIGAAVTIIGLGVALPRMQLFGPFICKGSEIGKRVALTFDDGPDPRSTPVVLDVLKAHGLQAAFFCVGERVAAESELAQRIVREGHLLENHSYAHSNFTNFFTAARLRSELEKAQSAIREATGVVPTLFRPPMGLSNPPVFRAAKAVGLTVVGWTARGLDTKERESEEIVARIERGLKPGAIVLLHDGYIPAEKASSILKRLLARLSELGYQVVRLDELLK